MPLSPFECSAQIILRIEMHENNVWCLENIPVRKTNLCVIPVRPGRSMTKRAGFGRNDTSNMSSKEPTFGNIVKEEMIQKFSTSMKSPQQEQFQRLLRAPLSGTKLVRDARDLATLYVQGLFPPERMDVESGTTIGNLKVAVTESAKR